MVNGYSVKIFGNSYLLAVIMPMSDIPDFCEFKRVVSRHEQLLGKDGWDSPLDTKAKQMRRDSNESSTYFTYYLDENVGSGATYSFRTNRQGVYSPWRELRSMERVVLPAPKGVRATVKHGHSQ